MSAKIRRISSSPFIKNSYGKFIVAAKWRAEKESNPHSVVRGHVFFPLDYRRIFNWSNGWELNPLTAVLQTAPRPTRFRCIKYPEPFKFETTELDVRLAAAQRKAYSFVKLVGLEGVEPSNSGF